MEALDSEWGSPRPGTAKDELQAHEHGAGAACGDRTRCSTPRGRGRCHEGGDRLSLNF